MGWVYVLGCAGWPSYYKIGRTCELNQRMCTLKIQLPTPIKVFCTIPTENEQFLEKFLHDLYSDFRVNGEWFALDIESLYFLHHMAEEMRRISGPGYEDEWMGFWVDLPESMNGSLDLRRKVAEEQEA